MRTALFLAVLAVTQAACVDDITYGTSGSGGSGAGGPGTTGSGGATVGSGGAGSVTSSVTSTSVSTGASGTCADGGVCAPAAPSGWLGPVALLQGSACEQGQNLLVSGGKDASATGSCACAPTGPAPCTAPTTTLFGSQSCLNMNGTVAAPTTCMQIGFGQGADGAIGAAVVPKNPQAACGTNTMPEPATYTEPSTICDAASGGCANGDTCIASQSGDLCVYAMGKSGCADAGPYTADRSFVTATTSCACGPLSADCSGVTRLYDDNLCSMNGLKATVSHPSGCTTTGGSVKAVQFVPTSASAFAGQCEASSPTVTPTTVGVCCLP